MQQTRTVELGTGMFIFLGVAAIFFLATQTSNLNSLVSSEAYTVKARFENIGGLSVRAPVTMAGVTIGRVSDIAFDPDRLDAVVSIRIDARYDKIPDDSDAAILTAGLLGGQYIGLSPGGSDSFLGDDAEIEFTQSAVVLENLISKYLFSQGGGDD
jgi:phospholipid/cholesterol/gamma-HCH transport system substrate-binding protein